MAQVKMAAIVINALDLEGHGMGDVEWVVSADPEGNEFCVAPADPDDHA